VTQPLHSTLTSAPAISFQPHWIYTNTHLAGPPSPEQPPQCVGQPPLPPPAQQRCRPGRCPPQRCEARAEPSGPASRWAWVSRERLRGRKGAWGRPSYGGHGGSGDGGLTQGCCVQAASIGSSSDHFVERACEEEDPARYQHAQREQPLHKQGTACSWHDIQSRAETLYRRRA